MRSLCYDVGKVVMFKLIVTGLDSMETKKCPFLHDEIKVDNEETKPTVEAVSLASDIGN